MKTGKQVMVPAVIAGAALCVLSLVLPMVRGAVSGNVVNHVYVSSVLFMVGLAACLLCYHRGTQAIAILLIAMVTLWVGIVWPPSGHLWRFVLKSGVEVYLYWLLALAAGVLFGWGAVRRERQDADGGVLGDK
jgi:hypothetical protein